MNGISQIPRIERLDFFNGQRLFAEDLQTLDGFNRQMRWLHNRSLHDFGIGSGFVVRAERGDREVTIEPGYAIDREGREIILLLPLTETVPPVADDGFGNPKFYDLTVHYPRTEDLEEVETRAGICQTHGVVRRQEEPVFCWIELVGQTENNLTPKNTKHVEQIANGEKIVLARISVKDCKLEKLIIANRRNVRPERLPYVACGRTIEGQTDWSGRLISGDGQRSFASVIAETVVNTSEARFAGIPCYNARVAGSRLFRQDGNTIVVDEKNPNLIIEGFASVLPGATSTEFKLQVSFRVTSIGLLAIAGVTFSGSSLVLNPSSVVDERIGLFLRNTAKWYVEWMGVEG